MALTKLGSAATTDLVPQIGDQISGDDFGTLRGKVKYVFGDATTAYTKRPTRGTAYTGPLTGYTGMFADTSSAVRVAGDQAEVEVDYLGIDPKFVLLPKRLNDLELKQINNTDSAGLGGLYDSLLAMIVPIQHPVLEYKFTSTTPTNALGTYNASPPNAPNLATYIYAVQGLGQTLSGYQVYSKTVNLSWTILTFHADGTCARTTGSGSAVFQNVFTDSDLNMINAINLVFRPDPSGWLCIRDDNVPVAGGQLYLVEQRYRSNYIFTGTQPGHWWDDARRLTCT